MTRPRFGVLLPHFGSAASAERIAATARAADQYGFDSVWVRDHLVYGPHGMEDPDAAFLEAFATLAYVAAVAPRLDLGTAAVIPFRHPLHLAKLVATLTHLTRGQVILGLGAGFRDGEFAAVGQHSTLAERANEIIPETIAILRGLFAGPYAHAGTRVAFETLDLQPRPRGGVPVWYCGTSPLALRLARRHGSGWVPGRITFDTLDRRLAAAGPRADGFAVVAIPLVSIASSRDEALAAIGLPRILAYAQGHRWLDKPAAGRFTRAEDLAGLLLAGTAEEVAEQLLRFPEHGVSDVVFDLRMRPDRYDEMVAALGEGVLPVLRARSGA